jgi:hypothetical protein
MYAPRDYGRAVQMLRMSEWLRGGPGNLIHISPLNDSNNQPARPSLLTSPKIHYKPVPPVPPACD